MKETFVTSFKLKNTYRVNSIIYSLKQLPLIKKILPSSLYANDGLKLMGGILSGFYELATIFVGKLFYLLFMIVLIIDIYKTNEANTFLHLFLFLTIAGAILNTYMFNPTKDKYYAIVLMNIDARKFTLSNYYYALLKTIIGFMPFTIIFGLLSNIPLWQCILLPFYVLTTKLILSNYKLKSFIKTGVARNENNPTKGEWILIILLVILAYGLPFFRIVINQTIFVIIFIINIILSIYSIVKINNFEEYKKMYKQLLTTQNINVLKNEISGSVLKESSSKQIVLDENFTSNKNGFAYFHELFVKRHKKILTLAVKKQSLVIITIFSLIFTICIFNHEVGKIINGLLLMYLPYFVFIMYLLNRGTSVTQAMFMNCDHSMLTYRIYRTPKVILGLFKERLKTLIGINLIPASIIALGLPLLLYVTGGTTNSLNYLVLFLTILALSIFFSIHYLILYYLLQPYNVNTEVKSSTYRVAQTLTYFICYYMIELELPTISFGIVAIIFCLGYSILSLLLAYRLAPKTFKLRL